MSPNLGKKQNLLGSRIQELVGRLQTLRKSRIVVNPSYDRETSVPGEAKSDHDVVGVVVVETVGSILL